MRRFYFFGILLQVCYRLNVVVVIILYICTRGSSTFFPVKYMLEDRFAAISHHCVYSINEGLVGKNAVWNGFFGWINEDSHKTYNLVFFFYSLPYSLKPKKNVSLFMFRPRRKDLQRMSIQNSD